MSTLIKPSECVRGGLLRAAPTSARFDAQQIAPHIYEAEWRWGVSILGKDFYETLKTTKANRQSNYNTNAGSVVAAFPNDGHYEALWTKHLMRYLAVASLYTALPYINHKITNAGIQQNDTEFGRSAGVGATKFMQDTLLQKLAFEKEQLQIYLCANKDNLDGYDGHGCPDNDDCSPSATDNLPESLGVVLY